MPTDRQAALDRLNQADSSGLFTLELGWDLPPGNLEVQVAGATSPPAVGYAAQRHTPAVLRTAVMPEAVRRAK